MLKEERIKLIIERLEDVGKVEVTDLKNDLQVSDMTIRRDLKELEDQGYIDRIHGGAILAEQHRNRIEPPVIERMSVMAEEKKKIAEATVDFIGQGEMIFLGSGTTTLYVARELIVRDDITVVTNSIPILHELSNNAQMTVIAVGGFLRRSELSLIGHFTESVLQDIRVNKVIVGMRGIHPDYGLTCDHPQELITDRRILNTSDHVIVVADHTKIGHIATSRTAPITSIHKLVTSKKANENLISEIRQKNIEVVLI
jgi:DeoR family transcriptional regulator of aga operon/DeoR family fructose operon transcriptional repressor